MQYDYLHEYEDVFFRPVTPQPCSKLWAFLKSLKCTLNDESFSFDRDTKSKLPGWQSETIFAVHVYSNGKEVFDADEEWDLLKCRYLLATQPSEYIDVFVYKIDALSSKLDLLPIYKDSEVNTHSLKVCLIEIANRLSIDIAEPGSEDLAIVIESTYPRK